MVLLERGSRQEGAQQNPARTALQLLLGFDRHEGEPWCCTALGLVLTSEAAGET